MLNNEFFINSIILLGDCVNKIKKIVLNDNL